MIFFAFISFNKNSDFYIIGKRVNERYERGGKNFRKELDYRTERTLD